MDLSLLFKGLIIGFSIAAPVGPIGVLCIRRTLADGRATGLATGLGAASADAVFGAVAGLGLTAVSGALISQQGAIRLLGGLFLCYLGVRTLLARPADRPASSSGAGLLGAYALTFVLTLTNPATILLFLAVFAGLGAAEQVGGYTTAVLLILGVFSGSALWWTLLSSGVSLLRERFTPGAMLWVNRLSGLIILAFGLGALLSLV
ncbi:MAG: LysE family transporter [Roseiflexaceae bacterium]